MSMFSWDKLNYWKSGEWQVIQERLNDLEESKEFFNPNWDDLFKALTLTSFEDTKAVIVGQDPYTDPRYATGLAFSIPPTEKKFPPTLSNILKEYSDDLGYAVPASGDLTKWCSQGVLLWNVVPSSPLFGVALGHDWPEWTVLTAEMFERLREKGVVFALLGNRARMYSDMFDDWPNCRVIETTHPSPRGNMKRNNAHGFLGSRLFSTINTKLVEIGYDPIEWRL